MGFKSWFALTFFTLVALGFWYLAPGSLAMVEGRTDTVMSDGTDPATLPYVYDVVIQAFEKNPSVLFYGAVHWPTQDPERGITLWFPWNERWLVILHSYFFELEQLSTAFVFSLLVLNGLCMFLLAWYLRWPPAVGLAIAVAWAFSAYTRARAKVHPALAGIYHIPLIFLGLLLVARGKTWRSLAAATGCFLFACSVAHYYLVTNVFLFPVFVVFLLCQPGFRSRWKEVLKRFLIAAFPAVLFLAVNYKFPLPPDAKKTAAESMESQTEVKGGVDPFLYAFHSKPVDYLAGDISLAVKPDDLNPLRQMINAYILNNLGMSNPHERTNGIRWLVLIFAGLAIIHLFRKDFFSTNDRVLVGFFLGYAFISFWLSLSPDIPFEKSGASYWLHRLVPKIRVATRAGIGVHFAALMLAALFIVNNRWHKKLLLIPGVLALLFVLDYAPYQKMPMAAVLPAYSSLHRSQGECGVGLMIPYLHHQYTAGDHYILSQRMRATGCLSLNSLSTPARVQLMLNLFPPTSEFLQNLDKRPEIIDNIERLARCVPLSYVLFHQAVPYQWAARVCVRLGWKLHDDGSCVSPEKGKPLQRYPDQC